MSVLWGCEKEQIGQTPTNGNPQGVVKNVKVENLPGGARISYELPDDDDLLYVKAIYTVNGVERNAAATLYNKSLEVNGFGSTDEQIIRLYCVDRSDNYSAPVEVAINPDTPPVQSIYNSMNMIEAFGGVELTWENENKAEVVIYLVAADSVGDLSVADVVYTNSAEGKFNLRGFDDSERVFGAFVRDRWDNYSDTLLQEAKPYFEEKLDKTLWKRGRMLGDNNTDYWNGMVFEWMFDDMVGDWKTTWSTNEGKWPIYFTIDLGVKAKLSRYTLWHRQGDAGPYQHISPKKWKIYGTDKPKMEIYDEEYWIGDGFKEDWTYFGDYYSFKPSGDNPTITQEDIEYAAKGFEFDLPLDAPPVRYIRFWVEETWVGTSMLQISEISFWGQKVDD